MRAELTPEGEQVKVVADFVSPEGKFLNHLRLNSNVTAPNRETQQQSFQQTAPGRYEGQFTPAQRGTHFMTLYAEGASGEAPLTVATVPYVVPYPKEYRELKPNLSLLSRLAEETGGQMIDPDKLEDGVKRLYTPAACQGREGQETWWPLSGLGLFLFMADLVWRAWPARATTS